MHHPTRISSPINRTASFEIAITSSPPLSPDPPLASPRSPPPAVPPHVGAYSPRRNVQETIMREVREYHVTTSRPAPPRISPISVAPIAEPESTSSFISSTPSADDQSTEDVQAKEDIEQEDREVVEKSVDPPTPLSVQNLQTTPTKSTENRLVHPADIPPDHPTIIFPITPFYRRKGVCPKLFSICCASFCLIFFLLSIGLLIGWGVTTHGFKRYSENETKVCNTRDCIDLAFRMSSNIDESVEICENFYSYSCQRYHSQTTDKQLNFLGLLKDHSLRTIHTLLSSEDNSSPLPKSAKLSKTLYNSCMNAVLRSTNAPSDLLEFIRNFPCGPLLRECQSFNADTYSWERHAGMLDWYSGTFNLILYDRDVHPQDRSKIILQIRPPNLDDILGQVVKDLMQLANPSSTEFEPLLQLSIRQNILSAFVRDNLLRDPRDVQDQLDEVSRLFVDLYQATRISSRITPNTTYMSFGEAFQALPQLYLREFLDAQLSNIYKWTEEDVLSIQDYEYFARLVDIMAVTKRRAVANYLVIITVYNMKQYSYSSKDQFGWRECVEQLSELEISEKMYIGTNVSMSQTSEFLQTLKTDFISTHRSTPLQYLSSINRLGFYVGYPSRLLNEDLVWRPVSQLSLNLSDYFNSVIRVGKAERDYKLSQIGTYLDVDDTTDFTITSPQMFYNPHVGAIVIPLAFLQAPIYHPGDDIPMYGIFSSLGVTVLQMISKIFWQGLDKTSQLQCLDNLYRGFLDANLQRAANIEPQLLSTIELADAFKTTIYSYSKWQNEHHVHHEKGLPAFETSDSIQSLMLTFSTLFCSGEGSEPGSDYEAMINTVAANSRMFSIHFNCNNSTRLYNRRTCL